MKHSIIIFAAIITIGSLFSCIKKNQIKEESKEEITVQDEITVQSVSGIVINKCTDKPEPGQAVTLHIYNGQTLAKEQVVNSGTDGQFKFDNVEVHSNSSYSYRVFINSTIITTPHTIGFDGAGVLFNKDELGKFITLGVVPYLKALNYKVVSPGPIVAPDSLNIFYEQRIYNKNFPDKAINGTITNRNQSYGSITIQKPMGWYVFHHRKWKGGIYSEFKDSILCNYGSENTHVINW